MRGILTILSSVVFLVLVGCSNPGASLSKLAKSDIDMVADVHLRKAEDLVRSLTVKLYRRNPKELKKAEGQSIDSRLVQLFNEDRVLQFSEIDNKRGTEAILLALDQDYKQDRVFALMVGLLSMVRAAYGNQPEFFMLDELDPQAFYNSARNIEILVWRLKSRVDSEGKPLLLTNSLGDEEQNLSFERLFGKLISVQDMMAQVASQKWDRAINLIFQQTATMVFLPVGF